MQHPAVPGCHDEFRWKLGQRRPYHRRMAGPEYHLLDPSEYQLHLDPSLAPPTPFTPGAPAFSPTISPGLGGYGTGAGMVDDFYHSPLFPSPSSLLGPGGGPPGANLDLWQHYTDPPASPGFSIPQVIPGTQTDADGIGATFGDWRMRFMPIIPGLNDPDPPDLEAAKKQHEVPDPFHP